MRKPEESFTEIEVADQAAPVRELKPVPANALVIAESRRVVHHLVLPPGTCLEDLSLPDYWSQAAPKLHKRDLVEVEPVDQSWWALLLCTEVGAEHARMAVLQRVDLPSLQVSVDDLPLGHAVNFLGPRRRWCAMRDTTILRPGFNTKSEAAAWLRETLS